MSKWNGKIRCVFSRNTGWKLDKVYKVVNGFVEREDGGWSKFKYNDLDDFNNNNRTSKFEEISKSIPQPHKSLLKSGMKVVYRNGCDRYVFLPAKSLLHKNGNYAKLLSDYNEKLIEISDYPSIDIVEIYSEDGELIAKREEKSDKDIKIDELEKQLRNIADELAELKGE